MDPVLILEETQRNTVHGGITPPFVKEAASAVQVVEVVFVGLAPPEAHIGNLKVTPEVASRVAIGFPGVLRAAEGVCQPAYSVVLVDILGVVGHELDRLRPQRWDGGWGIIKVDGEAVRLVVFLHEAEDVVVDIAEEVHLGLNAPIVLSIRQSRVLVEQAAVPPAHLVVGELIGVLNLVVQQELDGFLVEVLVDPCRHVPVLRRDELVVDIRLGSCPRRLLELFCEWHIVEECPWVVELVIPCALEVAHRLQHAV